jgi:hypothetical protein
VDDLREVAYFYVFTVRTITAISSAIMFPILTHGDDHDDQLPGAPGGGRPDG